MIIQEISLEETRVDAPETREELGLVHRLATREHGSSLDDVGQLAKAPFAQAPLPRTCRPTMSRKAVS
jgi:hypothetical protein